MFPFFFPSKISLKIEISRYLSPDGGRGGRMKDFFGGDHMVFRRNEQSVKGVCGKLTSNQMPMREDHKNITEPCGTYNQRPVTPLPLPGKK